MASARSTVSMARTTPAQKPRGEHSITCSGGFCSGGFSEGGEDVMSVSGFGGTQGISRPLSSTPAAERQNYTIAPNLSLSGNMFTISGCASRRCAPIFRLFPSSLMATGFAPPGGRSTRRIYHDGSAPYAESDRGLAGREHVAVVRPDRRFLQAASAGDQGYRG